MKTISLMALVVIIATGPAWTQDRKDAADVEKAFSKIAQLGPGVHAVKTDKKGRITSCIIVGQARISTVLGKAKGLQDARTKARLDVSGQYVKWLKEKVSLHEKDENETILFLEGSEENDKAALKESGKAIEKTSKKFESFSEGQVRGLQVLYFEQSDKDRTYTLVMGWSSATAKAVENIEKGVSGKVAKKSDENKKPRDKSVGDKKAIADDAKRFLP